MIKFTRGGVTNPNTGEYKDIVVKAASPNSIKDALIGGSLLLAGIGYLTVTAFKNGAKAMEDAELRALDECGLLGTKEDFDNLMK